MPKQVFSRKNRKTARRVLEALDLGSVRSNGYSFQVEMTFRAKIGGFRITEVPISGIRTLKLAGCRL